MPSAPLLDREFLEKLERLTIHWQKSFAGLVGGHNRSRFPGAGQEFLDHRNFHHGDDLRAVAAIARKAGQGVIMACDNTWATPLLQRPLELGADVVMHSLTKYLSGHTDVLSGALEHKDSMGNGRVVRPGEVQYMAAGTGVRHSEFNPSPDEAVHFLQIWIVPERPGWERGRQRWGHR